MQELPGVIFDMDGVIVDSELHWRKVEESFLGELIPTWTREDQDSILGLSATNVYDVLVEKHGLTLSKEQYLEHYRGLAAQIYLHSSSPIPSVLELIIDLSDRGFPLALASGSPHEWISLVLDRFGLRKHFQRVISSEDVNWKGKPLPDIYLLTARLMKLSPKQCIAIEDSEKGVLSALAAGMQCIGVFNGHNQHQDLSRATLTIESFAELPPERLIQLALLRRT